MSAKSKLNILFYPLLKYAGTITAILEPLIQLNPRTHKAIALFIKTGLNYFEGPHNKCIVYKIGKHISGFHFLTTGV